MQDGHDAPFTLEIEMAGDKEVLIDAPTFGLCLQSVWSIGSTQFLRTTSAEAGSLPKACESEAGLAE